MFLCLVLLSIILRKRCRSFNKNGVQLTQVWNLFLFFWIDYAHNYNFAITKTLPDLSMWRNICNKKSHDAFECTSPDKQQTTN